MTLTATYYVLGEKKTGMEKGRERGRECTSRKKRSGRVRMTSCHHEIEKRPLPWNTLEKLAEFNRGAINERKKSARKSPDAKAAKR